jgi:hypothetical protein
MATKKTTMVYVVTARKEFKCNGYLDREYFSNLAVYSNEEAAKLSVKRMVDKYLSDPALTVHNSGDNFVEFSVKGLEFDRFKHTWEIETHALL